MAGRLRIAIVGYGTGGQACALLLSGDGHEVTVFERAAALGPVGAGFLLQPVGLSVLWEMGLLAPVLAHGAVITRLYGETGAGRPVMDMRYADLDPRYFGLGLQRGALFGLLDAAWQSGRQIHCGSAIVNVDAQAGTLTDEHGIRHAGYDLVIVADGAASRLRGQVVPARLDRPYAWGAQWCLVEQGAWPWPAELQQRYVGARRMAGMLPVGTRPGDPVPRLSFFWSLPVSALDGDASARQWRGELETLWPDAAARLHTTNIPNGLAMARYRDAVHARWSRGRAVLLGDAAHAMSPQLGQGVNMALLDARALRDALRTHQAVPAALAAYERERRAHVGIYHFWSRWLTPLFQSEHDRIAALRDRVFHPLSRVPGGRGQMLRVLSGTRRGWMGSFALPTGFLEALANVAIEDAGRAEAGRLAPMP
ncbi:NAD(P)/FAD-dependent oxidoreductase [Lysobacter sp. M15]|uniref:FAD-dependent oxidoreductase n=1 Tax=Lysobacter sp. M15 TaxID=2916837 RepID=UPI001F55B892|nr:NAD(P)/FAD-dependent oxidoreductase [Lysobacter sp. M15]